MSTTPRPEHPEHFPMDPSPPPLPVKTPRTVFAAVYDFLSGLGLATVLLLLLGVMTWLSTLEQVDNGLYATLNKYFHWKAWYVLPEINGKTVPIPLPGAYWVGALLLVNLTLGGIVRIRKGWRSFGNIVSHAGIILMLVAGGVSHHFSERGSLLIREGDSNDAATDFFEYVVEISEIRDGQPAAVHVIRGEHIDDLTDGQNRLFRFTNLPFELEIADYHAYAVPVSVNERAPSNGRPVIDGYWLMDLPPKVKAEENTAACYARVKHRDGLQTPFVLAAASFYPFTFRDGDRIFTVDMRKRVWPMPFTLKLDQFTAEFHPGTMKPSKFISKVTRIENGSEAKATIQMNEPMRYEGLTFFQASYDQSTGTMASIFEVVRNPADKWPEYSLYIVTLGMLITFLTRFIGFLSNSNQRNAND
jgi:ResB-like family